MPAPDEHEAARAIAVEAGELLLRIRDAEAGPAGGDRADRASDDLIARRLRERFPDDAVLSEEAPDDPARLRAERVWIIDPLDGTREYTEPGRRDWAVHVALVTHGAPVAGAVVLPAQGVAFSSGPGLTPQPRAPLGPVRFVVSRTRPAPRVVDAAARLEGEVVTLGSAGAKAMAVVRGDADVYAHEGGLHEWDVAAPVAVSQAAGLHASRLDGGPVRFNQPSPVIPDLLICHPDVLDRVLAALGPEPPA